MAFKVELKKLGKIIMIMSQSIKELMLVNILGIDVSKGVSNCAYINKITGEVKKFKIEHNKYGFFKLLDEIDDKKETFIVFESTGVYSMGLRRFLCDNHIKFCELNPLEAQMHMQTLRRNKTDESDALSLALLGIQQFDLINHNEEKIIDSPYYNLNILSRRYFELKKQKNRLINALHSKLELTFRDLNDILIPLPSVLNLILIKMFPHPDFLLGIDFSKTIEHLYLLLKKKVTKKIITQRVMQIKKAAQLAYPAVSASSYEIDIIREYCNELQDMNEKENLLVSQIIKEAFKFKEYRLICSIPGVGQLTGGLFLGFVGNLKRFKSYKQLNAFVGIDVTRRQSGITLNKQDRINKRGNSKARAALFEIIRSMLRNQRKIQNHIIDYYYQQRKPPYSKHDMVALIACANHFNRTVMNLIHTNQEYDYQKATKK